MLLELELYRKLLFDIENNNYESFNCKYNVLTFKFNIKNAFDGLDMNEKYVALNDKTPINFFLNFIGNNSIDANPNYSDNVVFLLYTTLAVDIYKSTEINMEFLHHSIVYNSINTVSLLISMIDGGAFKVKKDDVKALYIVSNDIENESSHKVKEYIEGHFDFSDKNDYNQDFYPICYDNFYII